MKIDKKVTPEIFKYIATERSSHYSLILYNGYIVKGVYLQ